MTCIIGYLQGTDPELLSKLYLKGHGTIPLANYYDGHGKMIGLLKKDEVHAVVGHMYKVLSSTREERPSANEILYACRLHEIPTFLIVPEGSEELCRKLLAEAADCVTLVTTNTVEEELDKVL